MYLQGVQKTEVMKIRIKAVQGTEDPVDRKAAVIPERRTTMRGHSRKETAGAE